jgi:PAS domain S-box-containing protein
MSFPPLDPVDRPRAQVHPVSLALALAGSAACGATVTALAAAGASGWAWGIGVGGSLLALRGGVGLWRQVRSNDQSLAQARDPWQQQLEQHERRARQLDEAEQLVDVGSFDWFPPTDELHWSEQHFRLWGLEPDSVRPTLDLFRRHLHPDDVDRVEAEMDRALRGEAAYDCTHRILRTDGSVRHVRARGKVFFDDSQRAIRMIGAVLDITERVQADAAQRLFEFTLDAMPDAVSVIDSAMRYQLANAAWLKANNLDKHQALGRSITDIFPDFINADRRQAVTACLTESQVRIVRGKSPSVNNRERVIETRYFPFHDPHVAWRGAVMISRDVTDAETAAHELATSLGNLQITLNAMGDAIFASDALDPDEPVLFANEQLLAMWQIDPEEARPLTARTIVAHARRFFRDPDAEAARIDRIVANNLSSDDRLELLDGRVLMRRCRAAPREPRPIRVWAFRDITAEARALRALAEAESRQRTLLAAFPGFIWVLDDELHLTYLNPPAAEVYRPFVPIPGMSTVELFGRTTADKLRPSIQRALAGETLSIEWHRPSRSGRSPEHMLLKMVPGESPDGRRLCYAFGIDIGSLKQAQADLVAARDDAQRANQAKSQFLSNMSHELRTPLNAVIGFSQVLENNGDGNLSERQLRHIGEIRRAGSHLLDLINDLLDLARIESGRTVLEQVPVDLQDLAAECMALVHPLAARQARILIPPPPTPGCVLADRVRLKQVLLNLLSNAIKFNRERGRVRLTWRLEDSRVLIEVNDDGPGIDPAAQQRLFQPFERLDADASDVVGTGIGLALSRQLVHLMQGDIGVHSQAGEGCCFWVRLPAAPRPVGPGPADSAPAPSSAEPAAHTNSTPEHTGVPGRPVRMMVIDDNPVNLALLEGLLEELPDLQVRSHGGALAALDDLAGEPADALLVDLQMPEMDGFELFERLQRDPAMRAAPVIAVSADATARTAQRCQAMGFAGYVTKPIDAARLFELLERVLKPARLLLSTPQPAGTAAAAPAASADSPAST